jgi:hypothetical protein
LPRLQACLSEIPLFLCFEDDKYYELMGYWERLGATEKMVAAAYNSGLRKYEQNVSKFVGYSNQFFSGSQPGLFKNPIC